MRGPLDAYENIASPLTNETRMTSDTAEKAGMETMADVDVPSTESAKPVIEIGWIVAGELESPDGQAVGLARSSATRWLKDTFPEFEWRMPLEVRDELLSTQLVESVKLLDYGVTERNLRHWDFAVIITPADLKSHYKPDAISVVSRSLQAAAISTVRIDPRSVRREVSSEERVQRMAARLQSLVIHMVAHLAGLEHDADPGSYMQDFQSIEDLDRADSLSQCQATLLRKGLQEVADARLEEQADARRRGRLRFYLQAAWINRRPIAKAIARARPWQFPFRLSRLTTAAASAMAVFLITAEAWELGLSQTSVTVLGLTLCSLVLTTLYVLSKQRLLLRREQNRLTEMSVITNVSTVVIVLLGMVTTFAVLAGVTLVVSQILFRPALVSSWAASVEHTVGFFPTVKLAMFVASAGMAIGALGASFEDNQYFRHITFVDEEI